MAPKNFLEFWLFRNCFSPSELSLRLRTCKGSKKGWWHHIMPVDFLSLHFCFCCHYCKLLYILANHSASYLSIWPVVGQRGLKANLFVFKRIKMVFKDFWQGQFWIHTGILYVFLRIIITIQKKFVSYTLTPHTSPILFPLSQSFAMVFTSSHDCRPASALSFSTVCLQVVFGLSLLPLFPSGAHCYVAVALLVLSWSIRLPSMLLHPFTHRFHVCFSGATGLNYHTASLTSLIIIVF